MDQASCDMLHYARAVLAGLLHNRSRHHAHSQFGATKIVSSPCLPRAEVLASVTEEA